MKKKLRKIKNPKRIALRLEDKLNKSKRYSRAWFPTESQTLLNKIIEVKRTLKLKWNPIQMSSTHKTGAFWKINGSNLYSTKINIRLPIISKNSHPLRRANLDKTIAIARAWINLKITVSRATWVAKAALNRKMRQLNSEDSKVIFSDSQIKKGIRPNS